MVLLLEMFQITNICTKTRSRTTNSGSVNKRNLVTLFRDTTAFITIHSDADKIDMHSLPHGAEHFLRSRQLCSYSRTSQHFIEPQGSLPCSQEPSTGPYPVPDQSNSYLPIHFLSLRSFIQRICPDARLLVTFRNKLIFYGEELLGPRQTLKQEDHPLSAVRDCLFSIFVAALQNWRTSPPSATWGRALPWWQGTHLTSAAWERALPWWQWTHLTSAAWGRAIPWWQGTHLTWIDMHYNIKFHFLQLKGSLILPFPTKLLY
jgi:hypothetical protein